MRNTIFAFAAGFAFVATAALADDVSVSAQQVSATDRVVCHYTVHDGVLIRKPICKKQGEWDRVRRDHQQDFATFQRRTYSAPFGK